MRDLIMLIGLAVTLLTALKLGQLSDLHDRIARAHRHWVGYR